MLKEGLDHMTSQCKGPIQLWTFQDTTKVISELELRQFAGELLGFILYLVWKTKSRWVENSFPQNGVYSFSTFSWLCKEFVLQNEMQKHKYLYNLYNLPHYKFSESMQLFFLTFITLLPSG